MELKTETKKHSSSALLSSSNVAHSSTKVLFYCCPLVVAFRWLIGLNARTYLVISQHGLGC